jgi:hypothetical protein
MKLPKQYQWLAREKGPLMILKGLELYGTKEKPGKGNNLQILS